MHHPQCDDSFDLSELVREIESREIPNDEEEPVYAWPE